MSITGIRDEIKNIRAAHIANFVVITAVSTILAFWAVANVSVPVLNAAGISSLYIAVGFYVPFSLWFGMWGVLAAYISCVLLAFGSPPLPLSFTIVWALCDLFEGLLPLMIFKRFKVDEALKTRRDWMFYIVSGVFGAAFVSTIVGAPLLFSHLYGQGLIPESALTTFITGWFFGDLIVIVFIATPMLVFLTPIVRKSSVYVKGYFS